VPFTDGPRSRFPYASTNGLNQDTFQMRLRVATAPHTPSPRRSPFVFAVAGRRTAARPGAKRLRRFHDMA